MKFVLMINVPHATGGYDYEQWKPEDWQAHADFLNGLNRELAERGELVEVQALMPPANARIVRAGPDGAPAVTDGPFSEAKEFLAGFWMVDVETPERAHEIALQASAAPGKGGAPLHMPLEIRRVMTAPPPVEA
jgi:hypothetical protein